MGLNASLNRPLTAAGVLLITTAGIHAFAGGPQINSPVQLSELDPVVRAVSAVVWHAATALFVILGVAALWAARHKNRPVVLVILAVSVSFGGIFLVLGVTELGSVLPMPQWTIFVVLSLLALLSLRQSNP